MGGCYNPFCITRKGKKRVFAPVPNIFGGSMKKISAVLLVMVLVGSVAFAGFTGNAEVSFGSDLDVGTYGFTNTVELTSDLVLSETLVSNAGDGDIRAEITAELTFGFDFEDEANEFDSSTALTGNVEITSAKIVGDDWYVGILGAMGAPNFAESAIDTEADGAGDDDGDALDLKPSNYVPANAGIEVGLAGYAFGLSLDRTLNGLDGSIYNIFGSVTTPEFALADGITVALGASGLLSDGNNSASASAKVAYADDMLSATVSTDMIIDGGLMAEVAVAAAYDAYTLDVYFATDDDAATFDSDDEDVVAGGGYTAYTAVTNILSAKVGATVAGFDVTVTGKDLVNSQALSASAAYDVTEELNVGVNGGYTLGDSSWSVGGEATYTVDAYTLAADVTYASAGTLEVNASVESTTLVAGATLSLGYENGDILANKGEVVAKAVIAF